MTENKKFNFAYIELVFDGLYLLSVILLGFYMLSKHSGDIVSIYGTMAITLGFGDAFHLVPRMITILSGDSAKLIKARGFGKLVTSITMTFFYLMLWKIGTMAFNLSNMYILDIVMYLLAAIRIILCLFPQNKWFIEKAPVKWGIYRNIPFSIMGLMGIGLFALNINKVPTFNFMSLAILLSFAFYIPVVLYANDKPKIGVLMLPKTMAYIWIVLMGLGL